MYKRQRMNLKFLCMNCEETVECDQIFRVDNNYLCITCWNDVMTYDSGLDFE
jgi:DNA-directed RNA polymerase subunit RPC12/RpoP